MINYAMTPVTRKTHVLKNGQVRQLQAHARAAFASQTIAGPGQLRELSTCNAVPYRATLKLAYYGL